MTLQMLITTIAKYGIGNRIINYSAAGSSIYEINDITVDAYPLLFASPTGTHTIQKDTTTYSLTLYYLDRLLGDSSNEMDILSASVEALKNIIWGIATLDGIVDVSETLDIRNVTETEVFNDRLAGCYCTIEIKTLNAFTCPQ